MTPVIRLTHLAMLVTAVLWKGAESQGCSPGWFGSQCQYECHCTNNVCDTNGTCTGSSTCTQGWFGPACQYVDLVANNSTDQIPVWLRDYPDTVCATGQVSQTVTVNFTGVFHFTWLRLRVSKTGISQNYVVQLSLNGTSSSCSSMRSVRVSNTELDIHCDPGVLFQQLTLSGAGVSSLCSLYVSGGCNVALKQNTAQTSTYDSRSVSKNAVDGDTNSDFSAGSCTHTYYNRNGNSETWTLTFQSARQVGRYVIYNRNEFQARLRGFLLTAYQTNGSVAFSYQDTSGVNQSKYFITSDTPEVGVATVNITVYDFLSLCEVEIFGDTLCATGTYGRECENHCNCDHTGENCWVSTGGCPSGCATGYQGEDCHRKCDPTYYGKGCAQNCSSNCKDQLCDAINGICQSCIPGKRGPTCDQDCPATFFGENCTQNCSSLCKDQLCDTFTGTCNSCGLGVYGPKCDKVCEDTFYGENCAQSCSSNCEDQLCNRIDGICYNCTTGRTGPLCNGLVGGSDPASVGAIVVPIVGFIVLVSLIIIGVIIWM